MWGLRAVVYAAAAAWVTWRLAARRNERHRLRELLRLVQSLDSAESRAAARKRLLRVAMAGRVVTGIVAA